MTRKIRGIRIDSYVVMLLTVALISLLLSSVTVGVSARLKWHHVGGPKRNRSQDVRLYCNMETLRVLENLKPRLCSYIMSCSAMCGCTRPYANSTTLRLYYITLQCYTCFNLTSNEDGIVLKNLYFWSRLIFNLLECFK